MIRRIFLDIDDVLNRLTMTVLRHWGCRVSVDDYNAYPSGIGYNVIEAANRLNPNGGFVDEDWLTLPRWVWATVTKSPQCHWLIRRCVEIVGRKNVCLLSSATDSPECLAGKLEWIHDHLPAYFRRQYLIGQPKWFCASPDSLLIDDRDSNVEAFRRAGGLAILVPRPWNSLAHIDTSLYLATYLRQPIGAAA